MKNSTRNALSGAALTMPLLLGCFLFYALPFFRVILHSFTRGAGGNMRFVGLRNFRELLGSQIFRLAFGNTVRFLLVALPLVLLLGYGIALILKQQEKRHNALRSVLLLPYVMPVVGTVLLVDLLFSHEGLLNRLLLALGVPMAEWLHSAHAFWIVVLLYLWKNTGYAVILLLSGLNTISQEMYDAAGLDGATPWQRFRCITTPQMWYSVFFTLVFSLINAFKCFREIFLVGGTDPHDSIYMIQHFINNNFIRLNLTKLSTASLLLFVVLTAVFAVSYGWVRRKEAFR